jgi:SAM-dependent methyltransferase
MTTSTDRPRPFFSRLWTRLAPQLEAGGLAELRTELLAPLHGPVVEVGCGTGANFAHYPAATTRVIAVEPEPRLRAQAEEAAASAPVPVDVLPGLATSLPVADGSADAVVFCLVMCSLDDTAGALAEARRVLAPGGTLHFLEHTRAGGGPLRAVQRAVDATFWPLVAGGCHTGRDQPAAIEEAGFELTSVRRFRFPDTRLTMPATPHVLGAAVRHREL